MRALIMSDARLHHLGEVYLANPQIRKHGVLFYSFLLYPEEVIAPCFLTAPAAMKPATICTRSCPRKSAC